MEMDCVCHELCRVEKLPTLTYSLLFSWDGSPKHQQAEWSWVTCIMIHSVLNIFIAYRTSCDGDHLYGFTLGLELWTRKLSVRRTTRDSEEKTRHLLLPISCLVSATKRTYALSTSKLHPVQTGVHRPYLRAQLQMIKAVIPWRCHDPRERRVYWIENKSTNTMQTQTYFV